MIVSMSYSLLACSVVVSDSLRFLDLEYHNGCKMQINNSVMCKKRQSRHLY